MSRNMESNSKVPAFHINKEEKKVNQRKRAFSWFLKFCKLLG